MDYAALLNKKAKKKTLVSIYDPATNSRWDEVVMPISAGAMNNLLYDRWVKQRAEDVKKWSNGRLGYVHIRSMGDDSFRTVYSDILGKYNNCEGIVIDTRFNGGGRLHATGARAILYECTDYFKSFSNVSTATFNWVSSPLTTVSGLLAILISGSSSEFSR